MEHYEGNRGNARLTCRHFDISPQTFYRWRRRYKPHDLASLEERSRRPHLTRQPMWSRDLALAVQELREQFPRKPYPCRRTLPQDHDSEANGAPAIFKHAFTVVFHAIRSRVESTP